MSAPGDTHPKVFLSHASEDKDFVVDFAARLRKRGVDVWLDRWEIHPGDSLVDKIFEEGIAAAKAIIVVLSRHSVEKPWVREELDAAVVRKINHISKLIPVVIDDCQVPESLRATVWEKIDDLKSYEPSLDRVVMSIFGGSDKPPLGKEPAFADKATLAIGGLSRVDSLVLRTACEIPMEANYTDLNLNAAKLLAGSKKLGVSEEAVRDSVAVLKGRGYVTEELDFICVTSSGFEEYLKACRPDYDGLLRKFASDVVNEGMWDSKAVEKSLRVPYVLVTHILQVFADRKWIHVAYYQDNRWEIVEGSISPDMKRWLES